MTHSRSTLSVLLTAIAALLMGCDPSGNGSDAPLEVKTAVNIPADPTVFSPDAPPTSTGRFTLYSLREDSIILSSSESDPDVRVRDSASTKWDIGFRGTTIILNGGSSGPGVGAAQVLTAAFQTVSSAPETGYMQDGQNTCPSVETPGGTFPGSPYAICTGDGNGWYDYAPSLNLITPIAGRTIVIRTAEDGSYAKLRILGYYRDNPSSPDPLSDEARYYTFEYVWQENGSRDLQAK